MILGTRFTVIVIVEKGKKNMSFHSKMAWPPGTYTKLAITELDSKCVREINEQLLKTLDADVSPSRRKLRKTLGE